MFKGKKVNIYIDSWYVFVMVYIYGSIYERRGFLILEGKEIKNKVEIIVLLKVFFFLWEVVIIYCFGY